MEPGVCGPGRSVARDLEGPRAWAEGGTFGPGTVGSPEGTVEPALGARETEKGGRAGAAQWAPAPPKTPDGAPPVRPGLRPRPAPGRRKTAGSSPGFLGTSLRPVPQRRGR